MKRKTINIIGLLVIIIISFTVGLFFNNENIISNNDVHEEYNMDAFKKVQMLIVNDLVVEGYKPIFAKNETYGIAVPPEIAGDQNYDKTSIYGRQRNLIYKNKEKGVVVLLSISANNRTTPEKEWIHSKGYDPLIHNNPKNERYKEHYDEVFPDSQVYLYSYAAQGYNVSILSISDIYGDSKIRTLNELLKFTRKVDELLSEKVKRK